MVTAAEEWRGARSLNRPRPNQRDPLDKYTKGEMPKVHHSHPTAALDDMDHETIAEWDSLPNEKLLAKPFGAYAFNAANHNELRALKFGAVVEITKAHGVTVCAPRQSHTSNKTPTSFLIYNLSETQKQTLLLRGIWPSPNITFRVLPLRPSCPDYLFTITGLTTGKENEVYEAIHRIWHDETTSNFIDTLCDQVLEMDRDKTQAKQSLHDFINSMWTEMLSTRAKGNIAAPSFRVFAAGNLINNISAWNHVRNYLISREYQLRFQDPGTNILPRRTCSLATEQIIQGAYAPSQV